MTYIMGKRTSKVEYETVWYILILQLQIYYKVY